MTTMTAGDLLSIPDACRAAKVGRRSIYRLLGSGAIRGRKIGRRTYVEKAEIARFLSSLPAYSPRTAA